ncbi:hypothetical protein OIU84_020930 [Salix udensis]|uniref:Uncharacterized protein n=1 Tax=Salix udensis TaxID=889485 RepID=A0AAD6KVX3_9ROSI|nr:hypothetical protein OIU84_020930 [Salix udensis]
MSACNLKFLILEAEVNNPASVHKGNNDCEDSMPDNYTAFAEMSDLGVVNDLISGAEVGKIMFSLCISMSALEGISFKRISEQLVSRTTPITKVPQGPLEVKTTLLTSIGILRSSTSVQPQSLELDQGLPSNASQSALLGIGQDRHELITSLELTSTDYPIAFISREILAATYTSFL